jgi:hypothetical protein
MNETIGVAVYLVLALAIAVGIRAAFSKEAPIKKADSVTVRTRSRLAALAAIAGEAQRQGEHEHALPWIIPTHTAPVEYTENKVERPPSIQPRLDGISRLEVH